MLRIAQHACRNEVEPDASDDLYDPCRQAALHARRKNPSRSKSKTRSQVRRSCGHAALRLMTFGLSVLSRSCAWEAQCIVGVAQWALLEPATCVRSDARVVVEFTRGNIESTYATQEAQFDMFGDVYLATRGIFPGVAEADLGRLSEGLLVKALEQLQDALREAEDEKVKVSAVISKSAGGGMALGYADVPGVCWFTIEWDNQYIIDECMEVMGSKRKSACSEVGRLATHADGQDWVAAWPGGETRLQGEGPDDLVVCPEWPEFGCSARSEAVVPASVDALALSMHRRAQEADWSSPATHPNLRGVEEFACPDHPFVHFAIKANKYAQAIEDYADPGVSSLDRNEIHMTARSNRRLLNFLCGGGRKEAHPSGSSITYLEIGALRGSSLAACLDGNRGSLASASSVDSFVEFDGGPDSVHRAASPYGIPYTLYQNDFRDPVVVEDMLAAGRLVDVYLYDGPHSHQDHADAFLLYHPVFSSTFFAIVDDWNFPQVRAGTRTAFEQLNYTILYQRRVAHPTQDRHFWHNGLAFFVLKKTTSPWEAAAAKSNDTWTVATPTLACGSSLPGTW